jgi:hypothetical protein
MVHGGRIARTDPLFRSFRFFVCFVREEGLSGLFRHAAFGGSNW